MKITIVFISLFLFCMSATIIYVAHFSTKDVKSVSYYRENRKELNEQIEKCKNDPGSLARTPNCQNAFQANQKNMFDPNNTSMPKIR